MLYRLQIIRQPAGMTQLQLAEQANVARQTISKIESGEEVEVKISTLESLARVLNCRVSDFLCA